jgi:hypothetical protein
MQKLYNVYDNPFRDNWIGQIVRIADDRYLIIYADDFLKDDYIGTTQADCIDEIMRNYESYYFEGVIALDFSALCGLLMVDDHR